MAKATLEKKITTPAVAEVSETTVTLSLTEKEARNLKKFLGDTEYTALNGAGVFVIFDTLYWNIKD